MAYTITCNIVDNDGNVCPSIYIRGLATNPMVIIDGGSAELNFVADGTFYQLPANLKVKVSGATKSSYTKNDEGTSSTLVITNPTENVVVTMTATPRMATLTNGPFQSANQTPVDPRLVLSKAQMPLVDDEGQPDRYMCVCREDARMYIYKKEADFDEEYGRFRPLEVYLDFSEGEAKESFQKALQESATSIKVDGGEIKAE